jgi:long-subunit fatty acid transport protein
VAFLLAAAYASSATAQSNLQVPVQFDFLDPGARSLALGGTFTPLADDATAAATNPAGLVQLSRPEISFELRSRRVETSYLNGGRLSGSLTGLGIDTIAGPVYASTVDTGLSPAYVSFVYPRRRFSVAAYRRQLVVVDQRFERNGVLGLFTTPQGVRQDAREPPQRVARKVDIVTYGASVGYRVKDWVSVGGGLSLSSFSFHEASTRFATVGIDLISTDPVHPSVYGQPDFTRLASGGFSSRREVLSPQIDGDDIGVTLDLGIQVKLHRIVTGGAAFRRGPRFGFQLTIPGQGATAGTFAVPDKFSIGAAVRPRDDLTLLADYSRVHYSSLRNSFVSTIVGPEGHPQQFTIKDGNEAHAGIEYILTALPGAPALRLGLWRDPAHGIQFTPSVDINEYFNNLFAAALSGGTTLTHYTTGIGFSFNQHLELNAAGDFAARNRQFSSSAIVRF